MNTLDCAIMDLSESLGDQPWRSGESSEAEPRMFRTTPERAKALIAAARVVLAMREALEIGI